MAAEPADMGPWLVQPLIKTEAGRREITQRALPLARAARNLLLIIDGQRSAGEYVALVKGCGAPELQQLVAAGLVGRLAEAGTPAPAAGPAGAAAAPMPPSPAPATGQAAMAAAAPAVPAGTAAAPAGLPPVSSPAALAVGTAPVRLVDALQPIGYRLLYDRLTVEARAQLGLFKGYRLILEIEKCSGPEPLRVLALQFVEQVRLAKGDAEALSLARRLVGPG